MCITRQIYLSRQEEERSPLIPDEMTCDGCHAVAHQVSETFAKAHNDRRKDYVIKESDLLELFGEKKEGF